jgi:dolichol kinase
VPVTGAIAGALLAVVWSLTLTAFVAFYWPPSEAVVITQYRYLCMPLDNPT